MKKYLLLSILMVLAFSIDIKAQTGNTGIGTTDPQAKLHVNGDLRLQQGISINKFSTDSLFTSNSHSVVPTEKAIKDYMKKGLWMGIDTLVLGDNILVARGFTTDRVNTPVAVAIKGNYAFLVKFTTSELSVFDISDRNNPVHVKSLSTNLSGPEDIKIQGNYAYVASANNNRLCIFNISDPLNPLALGFISTGIRDPYSVTVSGNFAYVSSNLVPSVQIFDVTNPSAIVARGIFPASGASGLAVQGNFAYVAIPSPSKFSIFDISNPDAPVARGTTTVGLSNTGGVYVKDGFAYVASVNNNQFRIYNVSNPDLISLAGSSTTELKNPNCMVGAGNYIYALDMSGTGIGVFDISTPSAMVWKGYNNTNIRGASSIAVEGETVVVPSYSNNRLCVFELDRFRNISLTPGGFQATSSSWLSNGVNIYRGNGNVGIGISQPRANLHVEGSTYLFGSVGINTDFPQAPFSVEGNSFLNGSLGIGTASPQALLHVEGNSLLNGNLSLGTASQFAAHTFSNNLGNKFSLYGNSTTSQYGMGIQSGLMQLYTDVAAASFAFGYGSSTAFTERVRIYNSGYDGMVMNGRIILRNGTTDVNGGAGVWMTNPANTALLGFMGAQNSNNIGFYGGPTNWGFIYNTTNGRIGINNNAPNAQLAFSASLEKKITLYPGGTGDVGMSVSGNDFRLYSDNVNARVSFGYDDYSAGFISRAYVPASGAVALVVGGQINANGTIYNSDARYKKNIFVLSNSLEKVMLLRGVQYEMRKDEFPSMQFSNGIEVGLIAQEVEKIIPQVVNTNADGFKSVDYARLVPLLIEALKEQQLQRKEDQQRIERLEKIVETILKK
jgi:hypothetical protein